MFKKISDYGLIGNLSTCAIVGIDGSIDFMCYPKFDSTFLFAGILDDKKGGHFFVQPKERFVSHQKYIKNTNILQTFFDTNKGKMILTDFMPINKTIALIRKIECTSGEISLNSKLRKYPENKSTIKLYSTAKSGILKKGEIIWMILNENKKNTVTPAKLKTLLDQTVNFWESWTRKCKYKNEDIIRSALATKLLINDETGAICAAPTTSLPEKIGGERNWDYRFSWIRDASMTAKTLFKIGYKDEVKKYIAWLINTCGTNPAKIQIMYGLCGEKNLAEIILPNLSGYKNSVPVRIGNGAARQKQVDIFGEIINLLYETSARGKNLSKKEWGFTAKIANHVCKVWNTKDAGIWEVRGGYQHFVHSKLMCWVALDRAIKMAERQKNTKDIQHWKSVKAIIKKTILDHGYNKKIRSFVQAFDSNVLDATSLLIPFFGFLPYEDKRVKNTVTLICKDLASPDGLVHRYIAKETEDGMKGNEGAFLLCSFWLIETLAKSGNIKKAKSFFRKILKMKSPTGLLSEEIDTKTHELLGNYPQAYSHVGLINCALLFSTYN